MSENPTMRLRDQTKELEAWFERFTYKPMWFFQVEYAINYDEHRLHIHMIVPDSRVETESWDFSTGTTKKQRPMISVGQPIMLPRYFMQMNEEARKDWLRMQIMQLEVHEMDEWFKFDGEMVNDPHA